MKFKILVVLAIIIAGVTATAAQDSPQKAVASKSAKFANLDKDDAAYKTAIEAHNLDGARVSLNKDGGFKGKVTQVFTPRSGAIAILNFDKEYKTALTAVVNKADWAKFPDLAELVGKEVLITGKFVDFRGATQVVLSDPNQVSIIGVLRK